MDLTNPGLDYSDPGVTINPTTGMPMVAVKKYFKNDALRGQEYAKDAAMQAAPSTSTMTGTVDNPQVAQSTPPAPVMPKMFKPTFAQAAGPDQMGMPQQLNPSETKFGKLLHVLGAAAQGALAGYGQMNPAAGAQAARDIPFQQAERRQQMAQQQAQTALTQSQTAMVQTPLGPMTPAMAKAVYPALIRGGASETVQGMKGQTAQTVQGMKGDTAETVAGTSAQAKRDVANISQGLAIPVDETVANLAGIPELAGKPVGKGTWTNINKALEAKGYHTQDMGKNGPDENSGMWLMDKGGNRIKQVSPNSLTFQRGASFAQNKPEVVIPDENQPGVARYTTAAQAMQQGMMAPGSAAPLAAKATLKSATSGDIAKQSTAFQTAMQHADLLKSAIGALSNGNQQTLNDLKNRFNNEFGGTGPVTAQTIAGAYTREVTKMLSAGHLTDSEIGEVGSTLNVNRQSPAQSLGVINAYKNLAQSKMNILKEQTQRGMKGQANFPQGPAPTTHIFNSAAWKAANPKGDVNAAKAAAKAQGYTIQ